MLTPYLAAFVWPLSQHQQVWQAAKWAIGKWHESNEHNSALASDPRFCLTEKEKSKLIQLGINPNVAKEVLRECAISIENETTNGLIFWQNPHQELIEIARKIKSGKIEEIISMNATHKDELGEKHTITKEFHLKVPFSETTAAINISLTEPTATPTQSLNSEKSLWLMHSQWHKLSVGVGNIKNIIPNL